MKYIKLVILFGLILAVGGAVYYFIPKVSFEKQSVSTIISSLQKTREIDKFYTGVYYIPVMDFEKGYLKRDMVKEGVKAYFMPWELIEKGRRLLKDEALIQGDEGQPVIKGCCAKKYEVAFGYDHLMSIFENQELITNICGGNTSKLPDPQILAINCKSTQSYGSYDSRGACYGWDSNEAQRKSLIRKVMQDDGILEKVNERGKDALKKLLIAFCDRQ